MKVLIVGGCGYVGSALVPALLADEHIVTVYDTQWFGNGAAHDNEHLTIIKGDVRNSDLFAATCKRKNVVIYLAGLTNNDLCNEYPLLSDDVNMGAIRGSLWRAADSGVKRFIFASSVAAYGWTETEAVETDRLKPSTLYGHAKDYGESWTLARNQDDFICIITRSASVCGYAPALRTDLTVNKMVHDAVRKGVITVNGGNQKRCHVHIKDLVDFYRLLLKAPAAKINGKAFNVVAENATVMQTAELVSKITGAPIEIKPATDDRSYTVSGERAAKVLGFRPKHTVEEAVRELTWQFKKGYWPDTLTNPHYQRMADNLV